MKKAFYFLEILSILLIPLSIMKISTNSSLSVPKIILKEEDSIGTLIIKKLKIEELLYPIESPKNTIEEHISILKESTPPTQENSTFILAAHSGTANVSYFKDLNKLEIGDEIELIYKKRKYYYQVNEIWQEKKTGYIHINKEKGKQLVLTTCNPIKKEYQIIVSCTEKESNY